MEPDTSSPAVSYKRQTALCDPDKAANVPVTICGMGTVGSNVAYQLARLGVKRFHLVDFDHVEAHNLPSQQYGLSDLGRLKVEAAKDQVESITDGAEVTISNTRMDGSEYFDGGIVIFGFDNMAARRTVFELGVAYQPQIERLIDIRMGGNYMNVFSIVPKDSEQVRDYERFLISDEEALDLPCGGETVSYVGAMAGAMAANLVRQHVMGDENIPFRLDWDLGNWSLRNIKL